jgi:hypothetical protein
MAWDSNSSKIQRCEISFGRLFGSLSSHATKRILTSSSSGIDAMRSNITLVPTRKSDALLLAAQRGR